MAHAHAHARVAHAYQLASFSNWWQRNQPCSAHSSSALRTCTHAWYACMVRIRETCEHGYVHVHVHTCVRTCTCTHVHAHAHVRVCSSPALRTMPVPLPAFGVTITFAPSMRMSLPVQCEVSVLRWGRCGEWGVKSEVSSVRLSVLKLHGGAGVESGV